MKLTSKCGKKQIIMILLDVVIVVISQLLSLAMRFDLVMVPTEFMTTMWTWLLLDTVITILTFWFMRLYHGVLTFTSIRDLVSIFNAVFLVSLIEMGYKLMFQVHMPRSFYILNGIFLFGGIAVSRVFLRVVAQYRLGRHTKAYGRRTLLVGAGSAGDLLMRELELNRDNRHNILCIIDDNPLKIGQFLRGVEVAGSRARIPEMVQRYKIEEILIAIPSMTGENKHQIVDICNGTGCVVKILPQLAMMLTGKLTNTIRDISIHDLIGRESVQVNNEGITEFVRGKRVLITGGGGSIGSELCRQVMECNPEQLIIFDIYENNAYEIQQELVRKYGSEKIVTLIGSTRDYDRLKVVFDQYSPQLVFHAAAHKHVPLMEDSPAEAVKNNVEGTLNAAMLADRYDVEDFILISTDKAVRPTSVMGATKRICEMIVQNYARISMTRFAAVRFGNVLGSNGSVLPLFLKQIEEGGPVTVTHREITRFFMTIPEAVSLVLQASLYAEGGEIFVLDMGEPVKIYDLAESLIKLKGYKPGEDIDIEITGLRPGEKLYEEILMDEEGLAKTSNDLIYIGKPFEMDKVAFVEELKELLQAAEENQPDMKERVAKVCKTYKVPRILEFDKDKTAKKPSEVSSVI